MSPRLFSGPSDDEQFYARAFAIMVGPGRRMAMLLRACNLAYWCAMMAALAWLLSQALDRKPPVIIRQATLLTPIVASGAPVRVSYEVTRLRTCETEITWSVYDGAREIHRFGPLHVEAAGLPGPDSFVHAWATPAEMAPGAGRLRVVLAFECPGNYLQTLYPVVVVLPDMPFTIEQQRSDQNPR